ncbi:hypothetical protein [Synechocystis sp. LKSZ1]|uniref:hypothetical protein n=1 Tax=Synechocystis sp. LKSZ1 TaxID=3144951 RepID=UPI00336BEB88
MTLASEPIYALNEDGLMMLQQTYKKTVFGILEADKQDEKLQFCRVFLIKRLRLYERDLITLYSNELIEHDPLTAFLESIADQYNRGERGFGSRSK